MSDERPWPQAATPARLYPFAHKLRRSMTRPERLLWSQLRLDVRGPRYRRIPNWRPQVAFGPYVLDFYSDQYLLAIEVDGPSHQHHRRYDAKRDAFFRHLGIRTIRFTNDDVLCSVHAVMDTVRDSLPLMP